MNGEAILLLFQRCQRVCKLTSKVYNISVKGWFPNHNIQKGESNVSTGYMAMPA